MIMEKVLSDLVKPLVLSGAYKDETIALKDIIVTHIENRIEAYNRIARGLQRRYNKDFNTFTRDIESKATPKLEDDWMEWKGAVEMRKAWNEALKEVLESETEV